MQFSILFATILLCEALAAAIPAQHNYPTPVKDTLDGLRHERSSLPEQPIRQAGNAGSDLEATPVVKTLSPEQPTDHPNRTYPGPYFPGRPPVRRAGNADSDLEVTPGVEALSPEDPTGQPNCTYGGPYFPGRPPVRQAGNAGSDLEATPGVDPTGQPNCTYGGPYFPGRPPTRPKTNTLNSSDVSKRDPLRFPGPFFPATPITLDFDKSSTRKEIPKRDYRSHGCGRSLYNYCSGGRCDQYNGETLNSVEFCNRDAPHGLATYEIFEHCMCYFYADNNCQHVVDFGGHTQRLGGMKGDIRPYAWSYSCRYVQDP